VAEYVLFCFRGAKLIDCERFHAPDDQAAADGALTRFEGEVGAELWQADRRIEIFRSLKTTA